MKIDENKFFREATLRICGNLEIDKALRDCLLYIRDFIPADFMSFVIYLPDQESYETIAVAHLKGSDTLPIKVPVKPQHQKLLKIDFNNPRVTILNKISEFKQMHEIFRHLGWPSGPSIMIEMVLAGKRMGALVIINENGREYTARHSRLLSLLNEPLGIALTNSIRYRNVRRLKNLLADDKQYLQDELLQMTEQKIIGSDYGLKGVMESVQQVATLNSPVLLLGETGVGKEVIARNIHNISGRNKGPFIKVNCGAITASLIDSELFGHEKGAFTGAISLKRGRFERADGGTIFLDEIGELPPEAQVRLLRVLQDKEIERIGGDEPFQVDCRVIAATHRNLDQMIVQGTFREDLYFRLKVFPIIILPLRDRKVDIPALAHHFMQKKSRDLAIHGIPTLAPGALERLMEYDWPGNVRELENAVERELIVKRDHPLTFENVKITHKMDEEKIKVYPPNNFPSIDEVLTRHIKDALHKTQGRIEGESGAAILLGINPGTLRQKMRKLGIPFGRKAIALYQ